MINISFAGTHALQTEMLQAAVARTMKQDHYHNPKHPFAAKIILFNAFLPHSIEETRVKGAYPLLVGPACRSYFGPDGKIKRNGRHDLGDSFSILTE